MIKGLGAALALLLASASAHAGTVAVYVGYADGLRAGADFPNPFAAGETFTTGGHTYTITHDVSDHSSTPDSGAVMILNTGATDALITNLNVNDRATGGNYSIWTGNGAGQLGAGVTLHAGEGAIFAANAGDNFDTSDSASAAFTGASQTGTTFDASTNNCSNGPIAASVACTGSFPILTFTINAGGSVFNDTAHVLDTGGYDSAQYSHIHTGGGGVPVFNTNESLGWRPIGTTGIGNPGGGGSVPEPASLAVLGLGILGVAAIRRRG